MFLGNSLKNFRRLREITGILLKYGFEDAVTATSLQGFVSEKRKLTWLRSEKPVFEYTRWERIRMATEELGPTFVKFAQVLSNRADLLPDELVRELEKLQSNVPPFDTEIAKEIIEKELKTKIEDFFEYFGETPIGSASIGQVHLARLKNGEQVVVKIQRPNVKKQIETDLALMRDLATRTENFLEGLGIINIMDVVTAFERTMNKELSYLNEARNIEQFRNYYKDNKDFYVPRVFKEHTTDRVMIIEKISGCKITDVPQMQEWGVNPHEIAKLGMKIYLTQIFEHGYFHADPHPGNVLIRPDGTICLIDFGMVGSLMEDDKINFAGVFISMARKDARSMAMYLRRLSVDDEIQDIKQLEYALHDLIEDYASLDVKEADMGGMGAALQQIIYDNKMRVPGAIFLILRALAILEGIGRAIYPDFNTMEFMKPYGAKLIADRFSPKKIGLDLFHDATELADFLQAFPSELREILKQLRKGRLKFVFEPAEYEEILDKLTRASNRITLALLISGLFMSSSIVMLAKLPPSAYNSWGMPYVSVIGYLAAMGLSFVLWMVSARSAK